MTSRPEHPVFQLTQGTAPLLISMPHVGTYVPDELADRMTKDASIVADTDWHLHQLYDFAHELGASVLMATHSRYVIDLNRPPDNSNLYPGRDTTSLCPVDTFDKQPLYQQGQEPDDAEIAARIEQYWRPYHHALAGELQRLHDTHGYAALWDAHSIRCEIPRFFEGRLPDFNLGSADGASCLPEIAREVEAVARAASGYSTILNGRFKGGYITRNYGKPEQNVQAMQLELAQITYMEERPPFAFDEQKAAKLRPHLRAMVETSLREAEAKAETF